MGTHRPRLSQDELDMVVTGLRQYAAGNISQKKKETAYRLIDRLIDRAVGNPYFNYPADQPGRRTDRQPG